MANEFPTTIAVPNHWFPYTKLQPPQLGKQLVGRPELQSQLFARIKQHRLTLISAPAGSGKTTLAATLIQSATPVVWVALDSTDDDLPVFVALLVTALRAQLQDDGQAILAFLQTIPYADEVVAQLASMLINQLHVSDHESFVLILDDYHTIANSVIHEFLGYLIDYLPPFMQVVIATRHDPPLPLARWRMQRQLAELRLADLRFDAAETAVFLNQSYNLQLSTKEIAQLEHHTDGWVAGLQLLAAVLESIADGKARTDYIERLGPTNRSIFDLLAAEVFGMQPPDIQEFLLATAVLPELTPEKCAAVTGNNAVVPLLTAVYQRNLFLRALSSDSRLGPFRYHDLFADFLRQRLREERPNAWQTLHLRAATVADTDEQRLLHFMQAEAWEQAADLLGEMGHADIERRFVRRIVLDNIKQLPPAMLEKRPWLSLFVAQFYSLRGHTETAVAWSEKANKGFIVQGDELGQIEALIARAMTDTMFSGEVVFAFREKIDRVGHLLRPDQWVLYHGAEIWQAFEDFDWPLMTEHLRQMLNKALTSGDAGALTMTGLITAGPQVLFNLDGLKFLPKFAHYGIQPSQADNKILHFCAHSLSGMIHYFEGRVIEAKTAAETAEKLLVAIGDKLAFVDDHLQWLLLTTLLTNRAYHAFDQRLQSNLDRLQTDPVSIGYIRGYLYLQGRSLWLQNKMGAARAILQELESVSLPKTDTGRVAELLLAGLLSLADKNWQQAESDLQQAVKLHQPIRHTFFITHPRLALATCYGRQNRWEEALHTFRVAAADIKSLGLPGIILQEGESIVPVLERAVAAKIELVMIRPLLNTLKPPNTTPQPIPLPHSSQYITPREAEVLHLLATGATNPEIAAQLVITERTVKAHVTRILAKLDATTRTEAVTKANQLNLLTR